MTKLIKRIVSFSLGHLDIGYWKLFGVWDLVIGI